MGKPVFTDGDETPDIRKLREDVYGDMPPPTTLYLGVVNRAKDGKTFVVNIDGLDYEYRNFTSGNLQVGDEVAVVKLTSNSGIIVGILR